MGTKLLKIGFIGAAGNTLIILTVLAFFLLRIERTFLNWLALSFLLFAEFVMFLGFIGLLKLKEKSESLFFKASMASTLFLYFIATCISMLFVRFLRVNTFLFFQLGIIIAFLIIALLITAVSRGMKDSGNSAE